MVPCSLNRIDDAIELVVTLALAVAHRELRVDQPAVDHDLEGACTPLRVHGGGDVQLARRNTGGELVTEECGKRFAEALVTSAASVLNENALVHVDVAVVDVHRVAAAAAVAASAAGLAPRGAAVALVLVAVLLVAVVVRVRHLLVGSAEKRKASRRPSLPT